MRPTASGGPAQSPLHGSDVSYYRRDVDGLRGIAVALVIVYHWFPSVVKNGYVGVDVFFIISGFVVTLALQRDLAAGVGRGFLHFYSRRVKRILPPLYLNIVGTLIVSCLFLPPPELRRIFKVAAAAIVGVSNIALHFAEFDYFNSDLSLNPLLHTWSLGVEEQFYLGFPALLLVSGRRMWGNRVLSMLAALSLSAWGIKQFNAPVAAFYNPLWRMWEFLMGAILALNVNSVSDRLGADQARILRCLGWILLVAAVGWPVLGPLSRGASLIAAIGAACMLTAGVIPELNAGGLIASAPLVGIGKLSYSLYLWHYPFLAIARFNYGTSRPDIELGALIIAFMASAASYRFMEIPIRRASWPDAFVLAAAGGIGCLSLIFVSTLYRLPPSRIYLGDASRYSALWPGERSPMAPSLMGSQRTCHLQYSDNWSVDLFGRCSTRSKGHPVIFLLGNSHAQHLIPMLEAVSRETGYGFTGVTISSCKLIDASQIIDSINYRYDLCGEYYARSWAHIIRNARAGDIVLVGADAIILRPRSDEAGRPSSVIAAGMRLSTGEAYVKSLEELTSFAEILKSKGVHLVFAGPTPRFPRAATKCIAEWFRPELPGCQVPVSAVASIRGEYLIALSSLLADNGFVHFWDPASSLCGDAVCSSVKMDRLLFRDQQHLSIFGSESLAPNFIKFIRTLNRSRR